MGQKILWLSCLLCLFVCTTAVQAASMGERLSGKILLQVEENGEGWYIDPGDQNRYYLGRPADAFAIMRELGLGISNKDFDSFNGVAPKRLSGKILLKVEYFKPPEEFFQAFIFCLQLFTIAFNHKRHKGVD